MTCLKRKPRSLKSLEALKSPVAQQKNKEGKNLFDPVEYSLSLSLSFRERKAWINCPPYMLRSPDWEPNPQPFVAWNDTPVS